MTTTAMKQEISEKLDSLPPEDQRKVLDLARTLAERRPAGIPGKDLLPFTQGFTKEDLEDMRRAEEDCEKVDLSEW